MAKPPAAEQVQVNFRMPVDLRDRIRRATDISGRSVTAEIVNALERAFPKEMEGTIDRGAIVDLLRRANGLSDEQVDAVAAALENQPDLMSVFARTNEFGQLEFYIASDAF